MKLTPDDQRLSAYVLGELSSDEASVVERSAAADPAIRMSLDELEKTMGFLENVLTEKGSQRLLPAQREAVRRVGRDADSLGKVVELASARRSWKPWLAGLGAAAAVAFAALLMSRLEPENSSNKSTDVGLVTEEIALLPLPGPAAGEGSTSVGSLSVPMMEQARNLESRPGEFLSDVARHLDRKPLPQESKLPSTGGLAAFTAGVETRLPVVLGSSSLSWVSGWIRGKQELPPKNAVRVEELINSASLAGGEEFEGVSIVTEAVKSPWDSRSVLVAIQAEAGEHPVRDLKLTYRSAAEFRILGSFATRGDEQLATTLPAKRSTVVMLELRGMGGELGEIEILKEGKKYLRQVPIPVSQPSAGLRHAVGLAGFGLWLRNEGVEAREVREMLKGAAEDQDPVRGEVRRMMHEALNLADSKR